MQFDADLRLTPLQIKHGDHEADAQLSREDDPNNGAALVVELVSGIAIGGFEFRQQFRAAQLAEVFGG